MKKTPKPMKEAIQQAVYLVRLCVPVKYKNFHDVRSESSGEIMIVDFPLEQWTDTVSNEFRKQFIARYDGGFIETLKLYAESNYTDFLLTPTDEHKVLMGVQFHNAEHIRRLVEVLARLQQPNQPPAVQPDADSNTTPQPIDNAIIDYLPQLYDLLFDDGVIDSSVSKVDFINKATNGSIADVCKKKAKFKAFIKHIRPFFNDYWYLSVCNGMGLTHKEMQKYNTDRTADFEMNLEKVF